MKNYVDFIRQEMGGINTTLISMAVAGGLANGLAVSIALQAASHLSPGNLQFRDFLLFGICTAALWFCKGWVMDESSVIVESVIRDIRMRILEKLRTSQLLYFEGMEKGQIISSLSTDTMTISSSSNTIINAVSSAVMLFFIILIIAYLSMTALVITGGITLATAVLYLQSVQTVDQELQQASEKENSFYENLNGFLQGFKELKLNRRKADNFFAVEMRELLGESTALRISSNKQMNFVYMIAQVFVFVLIGGLLFILPQVSPDDIMQAAPLIAVVLFSIGPLCEVMLALPASARAEAAIANIRHLETVIDAEISHKEISGQGETGQNPFDGWKEIQIRNAAFQFPVRDGQHPFCLQRVDLTFRRGEIVFIVGGNGSGKSTFLKMLTGLYLPDSGEIIVDDIPVVSRNRFFYRELFSTIFTDYYLFGRLLDAPDPDPAFVVELLRRMELEGKTDILNKVITNRNLSTGQRKRLALIAAALEDKPILILDEWAADQDPIFRRFFYETLLPELRSHGRTIIAVTHDDRYFHAADRVLKMEYGAFLPGDQHHSAFGEKCSDDKSKRRKPTGAGRRSKGKETENEINPPSISPRMTGE